jgi:hypothetical protein
MTRLLVMGQDEKRGAEDARCHPDDQTQAELDSVNMASVASPLPPMKSLVSTTPPMSPLAEQAMLAEAALLRGGVRACSGAANARIGDVGVGTSTVPRSRSNDACDAAGLQAPSTIFYSSANADVGSSNNPNVVSETATTATAILLASGEQTVVGNVRSRLPLSVRPLDRPDSLTESCSTASRSISVPPNYLRTRNNIDTNISTCSITNTNTNTNTNTHTNININMTRSGHVLWDLFRRWGRSSNTTEVGVLIS